MQGDSALQLNLHKQWPHTIGADLLTVHNSYNRALRRENTSDPKKAIFHGHGSKTLNIRSTYVH